MGTIKFGEAYTHLPFSYTCDASTIRLTPTEMVF